MSAFAQTRAQQSIGDRQHSSRQAAFELGANQRSLVSKQTFVAVLAVSPCGWFASARYRFGGGGSVQVSYCQARSADGLFDKPVWWLLTLFNSQKTMQNSPVRMTKATSASSRLPKAPSST